MSSKLLKPGNLLLAIIVTALFAFIVFAVSAHAGSPAGYAYTKLHAIYGSPDCSLSYYPMMFTIHNGTGTDNGSDIYLNNHSLSWPNDVRFTDTNGNLFPYYIESYDANNATIWVNVSAIAPAPMLTYVNIYYGLASDSGLSNPYTTFQFFDNFATLNNWTTGYYVYENNGPWATLNSGFNTPLAIGNTVVMNGTRSSTDSTTEDGVTSGWWGRSIRLTTSVAQSQFAVRVLGNYVQSSSGTYMNNYAPGVVSVGQDKDNHIDGITMTQASAGTTMRLRREVANTGTAQTVNGTALTANTWYPVDLGFVNNGNAVYTSNGVSVTLAVGATYSSRYVSLAFAHRASSATMSQTFKSFAIRNYTTNEPVQAGTTVELSTSAPAGLSYNYSQTLTVTGSADGLLQSYPVKITVHRGAGSSNAGDIYLNGHSLSWPNDIRFSNVAGVNLPYFIESNDANNATVWVNVDTIPKNASTYVKLSYGAANDPGASNGSATFLLYDDFLGTTLDTTKWNTTGTTGAGTVTVGNGYVALRGPAGSNAYLNGLQYFTTSVAIEESFKIGSDNGASSRNRISLAGLFAIDEGMYGNGNVNPYIYWNGWTATQLTIGTMYLSSERFVPGGTCSWVLTTAAGAAVYSNSAATTRTSNNVHPAATGDSGSTSNTTIDWIRVRPRTANEPTITGTPSEVPSQTSTSGYNYYKAVTLSGSADGALSWYQVRFTVHNGTGSDSGVDIYLNNHSLSWPNDFCFVDSANTTLPYWIESNDSATATVWVNVSSIAAAPAYTTLALYYGKANATGASNGTATFLLFDHFLGASLDGTKWTSSGTISVSASAVTGTTNGMLKSIQSFGFGTAVGWKGSTAQSYTSVFGWASTNGQSVFRTNTPSGQMSAETYNNPADNSDALGAAYAGTHVFEARRLSTSSSKYYIDYNSVLSVPRALVNEAQSAYAQNYVASATFTFDYVYVRNCTTNEPSVSKTSSEQSAAALSDYAYLKTKVVAGSPDAGLTWYPVKFTVHNGTGTDNGSDIYLNNHSLSWPNDFRFTSPIGILPYWIESYDANNATVWVNVDAIPISPAYATLSIYYGKAGDIGASNGQTTFTLFDQFLGASLDLTVWQSQPANIVVGSGVAAISGDNAGNLLSKASYGTGYAIEARYQDTAGASTDNAICFGTGTTTITTNVAGWSTWQNGPYKFDGVSSSVALDTNYHRVTGARAVNGQDYGWIDGVKVTGTSNAATGQYILAHHYSTGVTNLDWVAVRKYTANEPGYGASSNESFNGNLPSIQFNPTSYSVTEAAGTVTVNVTRTGNVSGVSTVNYTTADGSAKAGTNYVAASGTLSFAANETSKTISVTVNYVAGIDAGGAFTVVLSNQTNAMIGASAATVSITNIDAVPVPNFTMNTTDINKGGTIQFWDNSTGPGINAWAWNYGDGTSNDTTQNPAHTFTNNGVYTVTLGVSNGNGTAYVQKTVGVWNNFLIPLTGSKDGDVLYWQQKLVISNTTYTSNGNNISIGPTVRSDWNDLKFEQAYNGVDTGVNLPYYIDWMNSSATNVTLFVNVTNVFANGTSGIVMYYGDANIAQPINRDMSATFPQWENFTNDSRRTSFWFESSAGLGGSSYTNIHKFENNGYHVSTTVAADCDAEISYPAGTVAYNLSYTVYFRNAAEAGRSPPWTMLDVGGMGTAAAPLVLRFGYWGGVLTGWDPAIGHLFKVDYNDGAITNNWVAWDMTSNTLAYSGSLNLQQSNRALFGGRTASAETADWYWYNFYATKYLANPPTVNITTLAAGFTANVTIGLSPLTVQFNDTSIGNPTAWQWNFGDVAFGTANSTIQNPVHTYANAGTYTVTLTVSNMTSTNTTQKSAYITTVNVSSFGNTTTVYVQGSPDSALNNYQINLSLYNTTGANINNTFFLGGASKGNWSDIAAFDSNGVMLPFWIENNTYNATFARLWVNVSNIPKSGVVNITLAWNNTMLGAYASSPFANASKTFAFFDGFAGTTLGASWAKTGSPTISVNNGLTLSQNGQISYGSFGFGYSVRAYWKNSAGTPTQNVMGLFNWTALGGSILGSTTNFATYFSKEDYAAGGSWITTGVAKDNAYHVWEISRISSSSVKYYIDGANVATASSGIYTASNVPVSLAGYDANPLVCSWILVKNVTANEPVVLANLPGAKPTTSFTTNVTSGLTPLCVGFTDTSTGYPSAWQWQWGDLTANDTTQNPVHTYTNAGTYLVNLTASNANGTGTTAQTTITVNAATIPAANFHADTLVGVGSLTTQFHDDSTGYPSAWQWSWGDATGNDTTQNPAHTYLAPGVYNVILTASNANGSNSFQRAGYIIVLGASFSMSPANGTGYAPLSVKFTDTSIGNPTTWQWNWGDGTANCSYSTSYHTYTAPGTYTVTLTVSNQISASAQNTVTVNAGSVPVSGFTSNVTSGFAPLCVQFTDTSTNSPTRWYYSFGDAPTYGGYSGYKNYSLTSSAGALSAYPVRLDVYDTVGVDSSSTVFLNGASVSFPNDVRFNDSNGNRLNYWVADNNSTWASIWVNVTAIPASPSTTNVTMMYGHAGDLGASNGAAVFPAFDNFTGTSLSGLWNTYGLSNYSVNGGYLFISAGTLATGVALKNPAAINTSFGFEVNATMDAVAEYAVTNSSPSIDPGNMPSYTRIYATAAFQNSISVTQNGSTIYNDLTAGSTRDRRWQRFEFAYTTNTSGNTVTYYHNGAALYSGPWAFQSGDGLYFTLYGASSALVDGNPPRQNAIAAKYFYERKAAATEPTGTWGAATSDGSGLNNPAHTYASPGVYTVSMTAGNANGTGTTAQTTITVNAATIPAANFHADTLVGVGSLTTQFHDDSTGYPTAWQWSWGDATGNDTTQNPAHTYSAPGTYNVILTASNANGSNSFQRASYITVLTPTIPTASFTTNVSSGVTPFAVQFTSTSTGFPATYQWDLDGDGVNDSTLQSPVYVYSSAGTYTAKMYAINSNGTSFATKTITAIAPATPVANFTSDKQKGLPSLTVQFWDNSTGYPSSWAWNFGDLQISSQQNPSHTYTSPGLYTVTLTASNANGSNQVTMTNYVTVTYPDFTVNTTFGAAPLAVQFNDTSDGAATAWQWMYSTDGGAGYNALSTAQNPTYVFASPGTYTIKLVVNNNPNAAAVKTNYITVLMPPAVDINVSSYTVNENAGTLTVWLQKNGTYPGTVSVNYATSNGNATAPSNYTTTSGTAQFATSDPAFANPGLETGNLSGWTASGASVGGTNVHGGSYSADITGNPGYVQQSMDLTNVQSISFWCYGTSNPSDCAIWIDDTCVFDTSQYNGWAQRSYTNTYSGVHTVKVSDNAGTNRDIWVDDFTVTLKGPSAVNATSFTIPIVNTPGWQTDKTFYVNLSSPVNATLGANTSATVTIHNVDTAPAVQFNTTNYTINETAGTVTLNVTKTGSTDAVATVNYSTANGTALAGQNYTSTSGTLTFQPGDTSKTFTVSITNTPGYNPDMFFFVNLSAPVNATLGANTSATIIIKNVDPTPLVEFGLSGYDVNENAGTVTLTIVKNGSTVVNTSVDYTTTDGTAKAGTHYTTTAGTMTFLPSETNKTFTVPVANIAGYNPDVFFFGNLSNPVNGTIGNNNTTIVNIHNIDAIPTTQFNVSSYTVNENAGTVTINVTKTGATTAVATVNYATANGTALAGQNYTSTSGTLTFQTGDTSKTFTIPIISATGNNPNAFFFVNLSAPVNATLGANTIATVNILNVDTTANFTANATSGYAPLTVQFWDNTTGPGVNTWAWQWGDLTANDTTQNPIHTYTSTGTYTVILTASNANGSSSFQRSAYITVLTPPAVDINVSSYTVNENAGTLTVWLQKNGYYPGTVKVNYTTTDGTAQAGQNYTASSGTAVFGMTDSILFSNPGFETGDFTGWSTSAGCSIHGGAHDGSYCAMLTSYFGSHVEQSVDLTNVNTINWWGYSASAGDSIIETLSIDGTPVQSNTEWGGWAARSYTNTYTGIHTVRWNAQSGYTGRNLLIDTITTTLKSAVNATSFTIPIVNTPGWQTDKTFYINLTNPVNATLGANISVPVTIHNVDALPVVQFNLTSYTVNETAGTTTLNVTKTGMSETVCSVNYTTANGNATAGQNYTATSGTLTFQPGDTSNTFVVSITNTPGYNNDTFFYVNLSTPVNATMGINTSATITIKNADPAVITPAASFIANTTSGLSPLTVQFNDTSSNVPTTWAWNFGDGTANSTVQNATHTYATAGTYTVTLTASNTAGANTTQKINYITAIAPTKPTSNFKVNSTANIPNGDFGTGSMAPWSAINGTWAVTNAQPECLGNSLYANSGTTYVTCTVDFTGAGWLTWYDRKNDVGGWVTIFIDGVQVFAESHNFNQAYNNNISVSGYTGYHTIILKQNNGRVFDNFAFVMLPQKTSGLTPLYLQFNDTSTGFPTSWQWQWGDLTGNDTTQNPAHTYSVAGTYLVNLTASNANGTGTTVQQTITVLTPTKPTSSFSANVTTGVGSLCVLLTDTTTGFPTAWQWQFGDGGSNATNQSPVHTYTNAGTYLVNLTASNANGTGTTAQTTITVTAPTIPTANFHANVTSGLAPLTVGFTDDTTGYPSAWQWQWGDGTANGTTQNPTHTYTSAGTYTANLTASNANGTNTFQRSAYITVTAPTKPTSSFAANVTIVVAPGCIQFTDTSTGYPTAWQWSFGDGSSNTTTQNPNHIYNNPGTYLVNLTASNANGTGTTAQVMIVAIAQTIPSANFTTNVSGGYAPLTVQFWDNTTGYPSGWQWNFGDNTGNSSTQNPVHTYTGPGTYTATLTASNGNGSTTTQKTITVIAKALPTAAFTANTTLGVEPLHVGFTDQSQNTTAWAWNFGDNTQNSTLQNPTHTYTNPGVYTVMLTASNGNGTDTLQKTAYITVIARIYPHADFSANTTLGLAPLDVQFTDASTGLPATWAWNFGDDTPNSTLQNPEHVYVNGGVYTATLTVSNDNGTDTLQRISYIEAVSRTLPSANFTENTTTGLTPLTVQFRDNTTGIVTALEWNFGDNTQNSTLQNPEHTYTSPGVYTVTLTASNGNGTSTIQRQDLIIAVAPTPPTAGFSTNTPVGLVPFNVQFWDESTGPGIDQWQWNYGDGSPNSTTQSPSHLYQNPGVYTVTLTVHNNNGSSTLGRIGYINILALGYPAASFTSNNTMGLAPLDVQFWDTSSGEGIGAWQWNFGDNTGNSTGQNPEHLYTNAGAYTVMLTVSNTNGSSTATIEAYITAVGASYPAAWFTANRTIGTAPLAVQFFDNSTGTGIASWQWDFGDFSGNATSRNPVHVYNLPGVYTVSLTVTNGNGTSAAQRPWYINVTTIPITPTPRPTNYEQGFNLDMLLAMILVLMAISVLFFLDIKAYYANIVFAGLAYFIASALSTFFVTGVSWDTASGTILITDAWLSHMFSYYSYLMVFMAFAALLDNTILEPRRRAAAQYGPPDEDDGEDQPDPEDEPDPEPGDDPEDRPGDQGQP